MASTSGSSVTRSVVLHTVKHAHLIRFLDQVQAEDSRGVSKVIRAALELYLERREVERGQGAVTIEEIEAAVRRAVEEALQGRVVGPGSEVSEVMVESPETKTKAQLEKMRRALEEWEE